MKYDLDIRDVYKFKFQVINTISVLAVYLRELSIIYGSIVYLIICQF